jgi:hypothetical protein
MTPMARLAFLPTPQQELLLKATLFSGDDARSAFLEWARSADFDRLDGGSFRLLPALHLNLKALGVTHALTPRLLSVYRSTWYRNQMLLNRTAAVIRMLAEHNIDSVLLKGAALTAGAYGDPGARPMGDADLLVRRKDLRAAVDLLRATGWNPRPPVSARAFESFLRTKHAITLEDGAGSELDLHGYVFYRSRVESLDDALWERSRPATLGGVSTRVLAPEDLLFHVVVHGAEWNAVPPVRWVGDACSVLRRAPGFEWGLVVESARTRRFALASLAGLEYLADVFRLPVPPEALSALRELPVSPLEAEDHALRSRLPGLRGMARRVVLDYAFIAPKESTSFPARAAGFPRFLRDRWLLESYGQMPDYAVRSLLRRVRGRLSRRS